MDTAKSNREKWIQTGYELFGYIGPEALNVERLSIILGINRSSFYHYFGDINTYETELLEYHVQQYKDISEELGRCASFADLLSLISKKKVQTLFHRSLLIYESIPRYIECFREAKSHTEYQCYNLWKQHLKEEGLEVEEGSISMYRVVRDYFLLHFEQKQDTMDLERDIHLVNIMFPKDVANIS